MLAAGALYTTAAYRIPHNAQRTPVRRCPSTLSMRWNRTTCFGSGTMLRHWSGMPSLLSTLVGLPHTIKPRVACSIASRRRTEPMEPMVPMATIWAKTSIGVLGVNSPAKQRFHRSLTPSFRLDATARWRVNSLSLSVPPGVGMMVSVYSGVDLDAPPSAVCARVLTRLRMVPMFRLRIPQAFARCSFQCNRRLVR